MVLRVLPGTAHDPAAYPTPPPVMAALRRAEDRHFWHAARNRWISSALVAAGVEPPATVLEVGCGGGAVACALHRAGYRVTGVDTAEPLVREAHRRCPGATFVAGEVARLPAPEAGPYRAVGFFDVLEHLDHPRALLRDALRWAAPGAAVVATVPALRSLHTAVDDLSGHRRRFEPGELRRLLESAGVGSVVEHGVFRCLVPLLRLARRRHRAIDAASLHPDAADELMIANLRVPPPPVNAALRLLCALERAAGFGAARGKAGATLLAWGHGPGAR